SRAPRPTGTCSRPLHGALPILYLAVAEKQGADWRKISGTLQNDILKEYIAQKEYIYPPEPSMRLVIDTFEFGVKNTPKFNTMEGDRKSTRLNSSHVAISYAVFC